MSDDYRMQVRQMIRDQKLVEANLRLVTIADNFLVNVDRMEPAP